MRKNCGHIAMMVDMAWALGDGGGGSGYGHGNKHMDIYGE